MRPKYPFERIDNGGRRRNIVGLMDFCANRTSAWMVLEPNETWNMYFIYWDCVVVSGSMLMPSTFAMNANEQLCVFSVVALFRLRFICAYKCAFHDHEQKNLPQLLDTSRAFDVSLSRCSRSSTSKWTTLADQIVTVRRIRRTHTQQTICSNHACRVDYISIGKQNSRRRRCRRRRQPEVIRKKFENFMAKSNKPFTVQACQVFRVLFALVFLCVLGACVPGFAWLTID